MELTFNSLILLEIDYTLCLIGPYSLKGLSFKPGFPILLSLFQEGKVHEEIPLQDAPFIL
jgi:hypothetical protein